MDFANLNFVDYAIFLVLAVSSILSTLRGMTREALGLLGWALSVLMARLLGPLLEDPIANIVPNEDLVSGIAWAIPFIITVILWFVLASLMSPGLKKAGLGALDRWLGVVFGFVRGVFMVTAIYVGVVIGLGGENNLPKVITQAQSANVIRAIGDIVEPILPADLADQLNKGLGEADIEALTPTQPQFIEDGIDAVGDRTDERTNALDLLTDEQN
ncbi:MAG: CvpA family protein [Candidatus Puniceispirillaceae bacterium]